MAFETKETFKDLLKIIGGSVAIALVVAAVVAGIVFAVGVAVGDDSDDDFHYIILGDGELYSTLMSGTSEYVTLVRCDDLSFLHPTWEDLPGLTQRYIAPGDENYEAAKYACWQGWNL